MQKIPAIGSLLILLLTACVGTGQDQTSSQDNVATAVAQTAIALRVEATMAASAAEEVTATLELATSAVGPGDGISPEEAATVNAGTEGAPVESSTRVNFEPGGTRAAFDGSVAAGQVDEYVVAAVKGQILEVTLFPPTGALALDIRGVDGRNLIPSGSQSTAFWSGLGATQDYKIRVISTGEAQSYSINIVIPVMIEFEAGESSQTINGHVGGNTMVDYFIYAGDGQEMHLKVATPGVQVALSVTGLYDGQPYLRYVSEVTDWTFTLPATQYYKISVVTIAPATDFTLVVEVN